MIERNENYIERLGKQSPIYLECTARLEQTAAIISSLVITILCAPALILLLVPGSILLENHWSRIGKTLVFLSVPAIGVCWLAHTQIGFSPIDGFHDSETEFTSLWEDANYRLSVAQDLRNREK